MDRYRCIRDVHFSCGYLSVLYIYTHARACVQGSARKCVQYFFFASSAGARSLEINCISRLLIELLFSLRLAVKCRDLSFFRLERARAQMWDNIH